MICSGDEMPAPCRCSRWRTDMDMQYIFVRHDEKRTHTGCAIGATRSAGEPPPRRPARTVWMNLVCTGHWPVLTFWQSQNFLRLIRGRILRGILEDSPPADGSCILCYSCHGSGSAGRSGFTAGSAAAASHCSKPQALRHAGRSMDKTMRPNPLIADASSHSYR
jgi:hypothetical protein